jgi:hypothetical protein
LAVNGTVVFPGVAAIAGNSVASLLGETFPGCRVAGNADRARNQVAIFSMFDLSPCVAQTARAKLE